MQTRKKCIEKTGTCNLNSPNEKRKSDKSKLKSNKFIKSESEINVDKKEIILDMSDELTSNKLTNNESFESLEYIKRMKTRVKTLLKKPQPEQRTPEWFKQRQTRVTASEAASCLYKSRNVCEEYVKEFKLQNFKYKDTENLNPYESREEYIIKKCDAFFGKSVFKDNPYTLWGKKYEEVANRLYAKLYKVKVHEFGLLSHNRYKWLAASPDGITDDGIMLEIKCPKSRKIDSISIPLYYWIQVQIQLETTGLDFCDFLECEIEEVKTEEDFLNLKPVNKQDIGIILQINNSGPDPKFIYPPIDIVTNQEYIDWKNKMISESEDGAYSVIYFYISKYDVKRIPRNKIWFANVKDDIKKTWELITRLQNNQEDFEKYKESIHLIKNKEYLEKWHATECLIHIEDSEFVFDTTENIKEKIQECLVDLDEDGDTIMETTSIKLQECLISSTE